MNPSAANGEGAAGRPGSVVLLLCNTSAQNWAADTVVLKARGWAREGGKVILADFDFEDPRLHRRLSTENREGVSDFFLYGASLDRIAQWVEEDAFVLLPAGTYTAEIDEIYRSDRWQGLVASVQEEGATLVVVAPLGGIDLDAVSRWTRDLILIGSEPDPDLERLLDRVGMRVTEVIESPAARAPLPLGDADTGAAATARPGEGGGAPIASPPPPVTPAPAPSAGPATVGVPPGPADDGNKPVIVHRAPESELELPPPVRRKQPARRTSTALLWVLFLLILAATAAYLLATLRPDLIERALPDRGTPLSVEGEEVTANPTVEPLAELLPYSVHVNAFASLDAAREQAMAEGDRITAIPFFVSPQEIQGTLYYRVLSGLAADTTAAVAMRDQLAEAGAIGENDPVSALGIIQFTPLAFDLGLYPSEEEASARVDSLDSQQIPAYAAPIEYSDGSRRWQLYGGAYLDSTSANAMREMLNAAGIEAPLTARTGSPATPSE